MSATLLAAARGEDIASVRSESSRCETEYLMAGSRELREAAFRLIYQRYLGVGLCEPHPQRLRVTPFQLEPTSDIFLALSRREPICTMTLVCDGRLGLPMETIYPDVVAERRDSGLQLAEASCFADQRQDMRRGFQVLLEVCRWMIQTARIRGVDQLLVAVHPRHVKFYARYMAFQQIGGLRDYGAVRGNPAVALCLDFARIDRERPRNWDRFFGTPIPRDKLRRHPMSEGERDYFQSLMTSQSSSSLGVASVKNTSLVTELGQDHRALVPTPLSK